MRPKADEGQGILALLLQEMHKVAPDRLPALFNKHAVDLGLQEVTIYLTDVRQETLVALPESADHPSHRLAVGHTDAGRAYRTGELQTTVSRTGGLQLWLPLIDGVERVGVLGVRTNNVDQPTLYLCEALASLAALAVIGKAHYSDTFSRLQRSASMRLPAEMMWAYLPPRTIGTEQITSSAALEPAYDLGGDAFDHSLIEGDLHATIIDAMGHDLVSGLTSMVAMAGCRSVRRSDGGDLHEIVTTIDSNIAYWFPDRHLTAIFAHLHIRSGLLTWINCGHPHPILLRDHNIVHGELERPAQPPLGMSNLGSDGENSWHKNTIQLEPGDRVLLYTDGVPEAQSADGERFGEERFIEFILRAIGAGEPAPEALRRLIRAILDYQQGHLSDDATILLFDWHPTHS